jgi:hypothetical protein
MIRFIILVALAVMTSCSPQFRVYSDMDPDYDLWTYNSFDWVPQVDIEAGRNPLRYNELNDKRIKAAVQEQMQLRGYSVGKETSELILHYHIIIDNKSVVTPEPYGYRYGTYWMRTGVNVYHYREGTLILDVMERKSRNLVWRGWAVANIDDIDPEHVDRVIKLAVEKIFQKFPAKPGSSAYKEIVSN